MTKDGRYVPPEFYGLSDEEAMGLYNEGVDYGHWEHFTPEFVGTKAQQVDLAEIQAHVGQAAEIYEGGRIDQPEAMVQFQNHLPVTIFYLGDVHYGSIYTDHELFLSHIRRIAECPNAFVVFMSNLIDNAIPSQFPANMLANGIPPDKQVAIMRRIVEDLDARGKVLGAVTSRCHEGWTYKHTGQDINALIFGYPGRRFPILENGGRLYLDFPIGEIEDPRFGIPVEGRRRLLCALYHGVGPFESYFSKGHALRQMNRLRLGMEGDILVGAHKHVSAAEVTYEGCGFGHSKQVAYIRSGTYKGIGRIHDKFTIENFGTTGEQGGQSVTILPQIGALDAHLDFNMGILAQEQSLRYALGR
jgi:hypothetical protein